MASTKSAEYKLAIQIAGSIASSFNSAVGGAQSELSTLGKAAGNVMKAAAAASAVAAAAAGAFAVSSVQAGMEFDSAMSQVAATMGKAADEIQDLREFAQQMGATTAFSATEAAEALNYMALAGYDAETSMAMLPNVLNLAAAGAMSLSDASDMITDAQSALGLTLEQTTAMVDQMAATASKTNTSVDQLGQAILTVGGTAQYMAGGTTELNAVLGVLADNGIKGSEGGTHLRNMLLKLASPTADATKLLNSLGVQIFDAQGNMRSFTEIFPELNEAMSSLTDQERLDAMSTLFNSRDIASATALLGTTAERWEELGEAIENSAGAAEQMANTQLDNLAGDITLFKSALEGAQIALSDQLTPSLREFVQFGSRGLSQLTTAFQEGGLGGAMEAVGDILSDGLNMVVDSVPDFMDAGMRLLGALGQGIIDNLPAISSAAVTIVLMLVNGILTALPTVADGAVQIILQLANGIAGAVPQLVPAITGVIIEIANILTNPDTLTGLIAAALEIILALADGLLQAVPSLIAAIPVIIQNLVTAILQAIPMIINAGLDLFLSLVDNLPAIISGIVAAIPEIINGIVAALTASLPEIIDAGVQLLVALVQNTPAIITGIIAAIPQIIQGLITAITAAIPQLVEAGVYLLVSLVQNLPAIIAGIVAAIPQIISAILGALGSLPGMLASLFSGAWEGIKAVFAGVGEFFQGVWDTIVGLFTSIGTAVGDAISGAVKGAINAVLSGAIGIINGFIGAINLAISAINLIPGVNIKKLEKLEVPQLAEGGIVTGPTFLEAGEAGDEAIIPLSELWGNMQSIVAEEIGGYTGQLAALTEQLGASNAGSMSMPISDLLADLVGNDEAPEDDDGGNGGDEGDGDGDNHPQLVIYYQPHLHFEGGTPSREDIVEAGRISQEEFNRMAAKWQKDMARLSLKE